MRFFANVPVNADLRGLAGDAILSGRFPHAVIIEGEDAPTKALFARQIAAALLCTGAKEADALPCRGCAACRKVLEDRTPDVVTVRREDKATIGVEPIRAMRGDMYLSPTEAPRKVYIIEDAHTMTVQAQNALLKVLEEPPTEVNVLLLCERSEAMLATVRSRAQTLRMPRLTEEELDRFAEERPALRAIRHGQPDTWQEMKLACDGCAGRLEELAGRTQLTAMQKQREAVFAILEATAGRKGYAAMADAVRRLSGKRKELTQDLSLLSLALRDLCLALRCEDAPLLCYTDRGQAQMTAQALGAVRLHAMYDAVCEAMDDLAKNANVSLVLAEITATFQG